MANTETVPVVVAVPQPLALKAAPGSNVTTAGQFSDRGMPLLVVGLAGAKAQAVNIPLAAVADRRSIYGMPVCTTHSGPGGYCTGAPFCQPCIDVVQRIMQEHIDNGRI